MSKQHCISRHIDNSRPCNGWWGSMLRRVRNCRFIIIIIIIIKLWHGEGSLCTNDVVSQQLTTSARAATVTTNHRQQLWTGHGDRRVCYYVVVVVGQCTGIRQRRSVPYCSAFWRRPPAVWTCTFRSACPLYASENGQPLPHLPRTHRYGASRLLLQSVD